MAARGMTACEWLSLRAALAHFATFRGSTQSQRRIKPIHWYVACRLVVEGGFDPDEIAVSCKGAIGAFRNLTNRMEEAVGDCTNLHIAYPPLVCGYLFVMRANRAEEVSAGSGEAVSNHGRTVRRLLDNDVAVDVEGRPVEAVRRFHAALGELADRRGIRNDVSRYESIALALASTHPADAGEVFDAIYRRYDERFVYAAPDLKTLTDRREWGGASPAFRAPAMADLDYEPRTSS